MQGNVAVSIHVCDGQHAEFRGFDKTFDVVLGDIGRGGRVPISRMTGDQGGSGDAAKYPVFTLEVNSSIADAKGPQANGAAGRGENLAVLLEVDGYVVDRRGIGGPEIRIGHDGAGQERRAAAEIDEVGVHGQCLREATARAADLAGDFEARVVAGSRQAGIDRGAVNREFAEEDIEQWKFGYHES